MAGERKVLLFVYSLAVLQGLTMRILPLLFGRIGTAFDVGMARQGQLQSAFSFGTLIVGIAGGILLERLGSKRAAAATIFLLGMGAVLMGVAPSHTVLLAGGVLFGAGNGWITVIFSTAVAQRFNERRQQIFTWAMMCMAVGGVIGPYLMGFFLTHTTSWRAVVIGLGVLLAVGALVFYASRTPNVDDIQPPRQPREESQWVVVRRGTLWLTTGLLLLHGFAGGIINAWVIRLYENKLSIGDQRAALLLSVEAAGFFFGRLLLGKWLAGRLPDRVLLGVCAGGALLPYVLAIIGHSYVLALVIMCWFGVMMSGDAPSIYSLVAKQFASSAGVAFALVQACGAIGATAGPWMTGWLGEKYGLERAIWFGPGFLFTLAAATLIWELVDRTSARRLALSEEAPAVKIAL